MSESNNNRATAKPPTLMSNELRVLGTLMEKQLTTPEQYPLTLNSLVNACNQKSSRNPVSHYSSGEVARTVQELTDRLFVRKEFGSRAEKFSQQFMNHLELGRKQQALLCVMMLRGPNTLSELHSRTQRMCDFADKEDLKHTIDRLCEREIPYAVRIEQQAGQRGERYSHLFRGMPDNALQLQQNLASDKPEETQETQETQETISLSSTEFDHSIQAKTTVAAQSDHSIRTQTSSVDTFDELRILRNQIQEIKLENATLKKQLVALYDLTGHRMEENKDD